MFNALSPHEYDVVQALFNGIAQAEWFDRNNENEKEFAKFVLLQFGARCLDAPELRERCEDHGRLGAGVQRISKPFTSEQLALRVRDILDQRSVELPAC